MNRRTLVSFALACALIGLTRSAAAAPPTLDSELIDRSTSEIARRARVLGDPTRGAGVFYRQGLACTQCHTAGEGAKPLGPDLSKMGVRATYDHVIESILRPSKQIQDGFKSERILTADGEVIIGMIRSENNDQLEVIVPGEEMPRRFGLDDLDARVPAGSMMPEGLVNQLSDEAEFYDLVSFLVELGKAGPELAASLIPDASLIAGPPLPEYEMNLDHAGMIRSWNKKSLTNGEVLYKSLCVNCHGTMEEAGSLPNALRFASGKFRAGSDPHSMYKTITHGFKMMLPQRQLVPQQKYDVIHYIRETYLKPHNKSQYSKVDDQYLASLPKGELRGPRAVKDEPWLEMDYGPFLISTYEMVGPETQPRLGITKEERERAAREGRPPG